MAGLLHDQAKRLGIRREHSLRSLVQLGEWLTLAERRE